MVNKQKNPKRHVLGFYPYLATPLSSLKGSEALRPSITAG
jgi:hypothetical protein